MNYKRLLLISASLCAVASSIANPLPTSGAAVNFSIRAELGTKPIIHGLVVDGTKVVLIRAVGTGLKNFGISDALADPVMELFDAAGNSVGLSIPVCRLSDFEFQLLQNAIKASGAFALDRNSSDAVILYPLSGVSSVSLRSVGSKQGEILLESYIVPFGSFDRSTRIITPKIDTSSVQTGS